MTTDQLYGTAKNELTSKKPTGVELVPVKWRAEQFGDGLAIPVHAFQILLGPSAPSGNNARDGKQHAHRPHRRVS
jgi:hypothetical protein